MIVTDLSLPGIDGFELISRVRADDSLKAIPIACLSGYGVSITNSAPCSWLRSNSSEAPHADALSAVVTEMIECADKRRKNA